MKAMRNQVEWLYAKLLMLGEVQLQNSPVVNVMMRAACCHARYFG
jgi:hypothetical protein